MSWTWDSDEEGIPVSSDLYKHMLQVPPLQSIDDWYIWSLEISSMLQSLGFSAMLPGQNAENCHEDWSEIKRSRWHKAQRLMCKLLRQRLEEVLYEYDGDKARTVAEMWRKVDRQYRSTQAARFDGLMARYIALDLESCEGNFSRLLEELDLLWSEMQYLKEECVFSDSVKIERLLRCLDPTMPRFKDDFMGQYVLNKNGSGALCIEKHEGGGKRGNVNYATFIAIAEFALSIHREGEVEKSKKTARQSKRTRSRSRRVGRSRTPGHRTR